MKGMRSRLIAAATVLLAGLGVAAMYRPGDGALTDVEAQELKSGGGTLRQASFTLECSAPGQPISPLIYGLGGVEPPAEIGITTRRWGGNPTTRYNWQTNFYNVGKDWFFRNAEGGRGYRAFLEENRKQSLKTALTVPMIGWVSKDGSSYAFPVAAFGPQQATAPENADMGNGIGKNGKPLPPGSPTLTSVASTPESIAAWVKQIRTEDGDQGRSVDSYILDNEPMLWHETHRDVHPEPVTYDELLERTIAYGTAIRTADPEAKIAGPAEWGWLAYHYSARDVVAGLFLRPDRRAHGDEPLLPWYLRRLQEHKRKSGVGILDILDVHFYPMGDGIGITTGGKVDPATAALRLRSTRSLWDPTYKDESWINERIRLIPLLKEWIAANHPGLGISIGEWNFGAENHMSGGLAVAEVLGRFGLEGLTSAYYWGGPADRSPAYWAFRAYRNFDGKGGRFLDRTVPVAGSATLTSLFASRDEAGKKVVAVLLNLSALTPLVPSITVTGCGAVAGARTMVYKGGSEAFTDLESSHSGSIVKLTAAPYSITVIELALEGPAAAAPKE